MGIFMTDNTDRIHVLFAHGEMDYLTATAIALRRRGFVVSTAANSTSALMALLRETIDVIALDVRVPGISDDDLFTTIHSRWTEIPVLKLIGHGEVGQPPPSTREGVVEHLGSPVDIEKLASTLRVLTDQAKASPSESGDPSADQAIQVLVVDDEQDQLDLFAKLLGRRGMKVDTAMNGGRALELLEQRPHDVVLLDLRLQGESGLDVLERIKSVYPSLEVIFTTGDTSAKSAMEGLRKGAFDYLVKPVQVDKLLTRIRAARQRRHRRT